MLMLLQLDDVLYHISSWCLLKLQVNTNGVISFLVQVSQYTPDAFPLGDNRRLVAPFWADVDTRKGGDVFYRETTDLNLLQQATNDVTATFVDQRKFKATWLLIATWHDVAFYGASGNYTSKVSRLSYIRYVSPFIQVVCLSNINRYMCYWEAKMAGCWPSKFIFCKILPVK